MRRLPALWGAALGSAIGLGAVLGLSRTHVWSSKSVEAQMLRSEERPIPSDLLPDERNTIEVFRRTSASVVYVMNTARQRDFFSLNVVEVQQGSGSGFVWDRQGHIVTNFHVVQNGDAFSVTLADGKQYEAKLVGIEPYKDLAVLRIDAPQEHLQPLQLGDSNALVVGQKVLAIGNPFGLDQTLTTGIISALGREIQSVAGTTIQDVIQTDASINPGNSGGPLLDSAGRVIGLNTAIVSPSGASAGIGFAVPVAAIQRVVPQLIEHGHVTRAGLGVVLLPDNYPQFLGVEGIMIRSVVPGGVADRAGLKAARWVGYRRIDPGDVIIGIDDHKLRTFDDLYTVLDQHQPGDRVKVRVRRGDQEREVTVTLQKVEEAQ